jgi:molybdenum cofactor biosynthesis enzyme MoaA
VQEWLQSPDRFGSSVIRRDGIYIDDVDDVFREIFRPLKINAVTMYPLDEEQIEEPMRWARINPILEKKKQIEDEMYYKEVLGEFDKELGLLKKFVEVENERSKQN